MKKVRDILQVVLIVFAIVLTLDLLTNVLDTKNYAWDFVYYIALAKDGFDAQPLASPFAYRYLTPFIVNILSRVTGLSIDSGFLAVAWFGALTQLTGIFIFTNWLTKSRKGAAIAMTVTALSLFNVKFLLFDIYRPDHLAYVLILLQTWFAFEQKFLPLLITTVIASQIREFNIVPLVAYLFVVLRMEERTKFIRQTALSTLFLIPAVLIPRALIPVTENYQIVGFSAEAIMTTLLLPFMPSVGINFLFSILAYLLPLLFIADMKTIKATLDGLPNNQRIYLYAYSIIVLFLSFLGGTDFFRFATFLFLPQIILLGIIAPQKQSLQVGLMLAATFFFNRIWLPFPIWDREQYLDFYGGHSLRLSRATLYRILEYVAFVSLGCFVKGLQKNNSEKFLNYH